MVSLTVFCQTIEIDALCALTQDNPRRPDWDPILKEARLVGGATAPVVGVRARCMGRNDLGMETRFVSFHPPGACAVEMTRGPWCFRSLSGSRRFRPIGPGRTVVASTYHLVGRPRWISPVLRRRHPAAAG